MIKNLRRKFIGVTMLSVVIVLSVLIGIINFANYRNINANLNLRLDLIERSGGNLDNSRGEKNPAGRSVPDGNPAPNDASTPDGNPAPSDASAPDGNPAPNNAPAPDGNPAERPKPADSLSFERQSLTFSFRNHLSEEAFFDTRYFTVTIGADGSINAINADHIAATSEAQAKELALSSYEKNRTDGFIDNYKFRAITASDGASVMYIFLDAARELSTFYNFLYASLAVCAIGNVLIFLLVVILSKIAIRPVAESYEKQKRFITDASHEIKTPLAIIEANTEVVEMENGESEWTKSIRNQVARLSSLTEKLVFLSRMDEEGTRLTVTDFNLSETVAETAENFMGSALSSGRTLTLSIAPDISYRGDKAMLTQFVSLLLDNAMKYAAPDSEITLSLKEQRRGKHSLLLIQENAVEKIDAGNLDILFERFYRSDPSRSFSTGGHGIGLSVAAAIVHAHGGVIHAESDDGKSIRFIVRL